MPLEHLRLQYSDRVDALCPGYLEIKYKSITVTTGLLGQGVTNVISLHIWLADSKETAGAWIAAIDAKNTPSMIILSQHTPP